jgi:TRAP-type C4-dicarboxylate transport system permease large subunit
VCVTIASACQGVLIPPSHNMIIYAAAIGGLSVGKLFMAGLIPGIILGIALGITTYVIAVKRNYPKDGKYTFKESIKIIIDSGLGMFTAVLIIGGVFTGIVTANESAVLACIWGLIVALFFYRGITVRDIWPILRSTLRTLAMVMTLIARKGS